MIQSCLDYSGVIVVNDPTIASLHHPIRYIKSSRYFNLSSFFSFFWKIFNAKFNALSGAKKTAKTRQKALCWRKIVKRIKTHPSAWKKTVEMKRRSFFAAGSSLIAEITSFWKKTWFFFGGLEISLLWILYILNCRVYSWIQCQFHIMLIWINDRE